MSSRANAARYLLQVCRAHRLIHRWGESSGSQSVAYQMVANGGDGEGLLRAGWMDSGTVKSASSVTTLQPTFDFIASEVGCTPGSAGVLDCIRGVSTEALSAAMDKTPTIFTYGVCCTRASFIYVVGDMLSSGDGNV